MRVLAQIAGYPEKIAQFLETNAGLARRFEQHFVFPSYSPAEVGQVFVRQAWTQGFGIEPNLEDGELIGRMLTRHTTAAFRASHRAANARLAERLLKQAYLALRRRNVLANDFEAADLEAAAAAIGAESRAWEKERARRDEAAAGSGDDESSNESE